MSARRTERGRRALRLWLIVIAWVVFGGCIPSLRVWEPTGGRAVGDPAVSPDGRYVAFSETKGKRPFLVAKSVASTYHSSFDRPGGYWGERSDVVLHRIDGSGERVLTQGSAGGSQPRWSPDAKYLYFSAKQGAVHSLYRVGVEDSERVEIPRASNEDDELVDATPDGREIVFQRKSSETSLIIAASDGSNQRTLVGRAWWPHWSPDGRWILHKRVGDEGAWIIHPDGSGSRRVDTNEGVGGVNTTMEIGWTPDSEAILYTTSTPCEAPPGSTCHPLVVDLRLVRLDGTGRKTLLADVAANGYADGRLEPRCRWSPDGTRLALAVNAVREANDGIVIINRAGAIVDDYRVRVSRHFFRGACWAPDGKSIWYRKEPFFDETTGGIYRMNADGTGETRVIEDDVRWSELPSMTPETYVQKVRQLQE